ncbi:MAG: S9 family peptidase, partial [Thermoanaerobaculia bacterium]
MSRRLLFPLLLVAATASGAITDRTANNGNVVLEGVPEIPAELTSRLNRYLNVRSASFRSWTRDGSGMFVTTRFGEVSQLHRVDSPGSSRRQLTFFPEPMRDADRRPGGSDLLLFMDEGGGEFYQLFLFDPATGETRRLTDGKSRNSSARWSHDGERVAYQSTRRNGASNDIWVLEPAQPEAAQLVLEAPDGAHWSASDWSTDGGRLLISQYISINDSRIHLVDLESGERRLLAGGDDDPGSHSGIRPLFDASGEGFFSATDADGEFRQLVHTRIDSGERRPVTAGIPWDVRQLALSDDRTRAAFVVNQDGIDRLYLLDPVSLDHRPVEGLPTGLIGGLTFSPDGRRLAMNLNTPQTPTDVYSLEIGVEPLTATGLTRWTWSEVGGLDTERFAVPELIHYPTFDEVAGEPRQIPAFVYLPPGEGPHPVILSIHGGPEGQFRPAFRSQFQTWIDLLGAAVVAPNVRGSS